MTLFSLTLLSSQSEPDPSGEPSSADTEGIVKFLTTYSEKVFSTSFTSVNSMWEDIKVSKGAKIRNRYNEVPHLTQDTNG